MGEEQRLFDRVWAVVDDLVAGHGGGPGTVPTVPRAGSRPGAPTVRRAQAYVVTIDAGDTAIDAVRVGDWDWVLLGAGGTRPVRADTCAFAARLDPRAPVVLDRLCTYGIDGTDT